LPSEYVYGANNTANNIRKSPNEKNKLVTHLYGKMHQSLNLENSNLWKIKVKNMNLKSCLLITSKLKNIKMWKDYVIRSFSLTK